ncbi:hypothetical protein E4Z66_01105 [Aliishimia ponticola]|uniref:Urocanase Rossmann-like domain-containing protein n=1 Tax=Aliishimia ponticola TaxID=2499833 RepID=A0A4S4NF65_9RHOB|nr:hypothetical protein E4Z66_01105 [Aliishimia ponticola]
MARSGDGRSCTGHDSLYRGMAENPQALVVHDGEKTYSLGAALAMIDRCTKAGEARSVALLGNAADLFPEIHRQGLRPDIVTDQARKDLLPDNADLHNWRDMARDHGRRRPGTLRN